MTDTTSQTIGAPPDDGLPVRQVLKNGDVEWRLPNGTLHRLDGPAHERADGVRTWYVNGRRHRLNGPAVERGSDYSWYVRGRRVAATLDLNELYDDGEIELLTHVLSTWQPDGPTVWRLIKAIRPAQL